MQYLKYPDPEIPNLLPQVLQIFSPVCLLGFSLDSLIIRPSSDKCQSLRFPSFFYDFQFFSLYRNSLLHALQINSNPVIPYPKILQDHLLPPHQHPNKYIYQSPEVMKESAICNMLQ